MEGHWNDSKRGYTKERTRVEKSMFVKPKLRTYSTIENGAVITLGTKPAYPNP